jgi:hypothetical protein
VHVTTDAGAHWTLVTPPQLTQWAQISSIEPSHSDKATAYLTANRYMWDDFRPYVYKTTDFGAHWTRITSGLPDDQFVFAVRQDPREPNLLFAGTRSTVYASYNGGILWEPLTLNLPSVQVRDIAIDARQGDVAVATHGRAFWILDNLRLLEQLSVLRPEVSKGQHDEVRLFAPETAWLSHAYGAAPFPGPNMGQNPEYGASVFFNVPHDYNGKIPVRLTFLDPKGRTVRAFELHLRNKNEKKLSDAALEAMDAAQQMAYGLKQQTEIEPGMNVFQWDLRYAPATEVRGFRLPTTDDITDSTQGPTIVPGEYTAVLNYGAAGARQSFAVSLDPRLHPTPDALAARLSLAMQIHGTLNSLNAAINDALSARSKVPASKRAQLDRALDGAVQMQILSTEGDVMHEVRLRDYLAFLMNELDTAYQEPTAAEYSTYRELRAQAQTTIAQLRSLLR